MASISNEALDLESVTFPKGCSVRVYHRRVAEIPFEWHHHPANRLLTLTLEARRRLAIHQVISAGKIRVTGSGAGALGPAGTPGPPPQPSIEANSVQRGNDLVLGT